MYPGTPAEVVRNLQILNRTRLMGEDGEFEDRRYISPNFTPAAPNNPGAFDPANTEKENPLMELYNAALAAGSLSKVRKTVDAINELRQKIGGGQFKPATDFDIISHQQNFLGATARTIISQRAGAEMEGATVWFDNPAAFSDLNNYVAS